MPTLMAGLLALPACAQSDLVAVPTDASSLSWTDVGLVVDGDDSTGLECTHYMGSTGSRSECTVAVERDDRRDILGTLTATLVTDAGDPQDCNDISVRFGTSEPDESFCNPQHNFGSDDTITVTCGPMSGYDSPEQVVITWEDGGGSCPVSLVEVDNGLRL